jgi:pentatricopeptide repeat protein
MYGKCGNMANAWKLFNNVPSQNVVTWTTMISVHIKHNQRKKTLQLIPKMQQEGS